MNERFIPQKPASEKFKFDVAVQKKLDEITEEVRSKFVAIHKESPNAFDDEDIMKGVQLSLQVNINACNDPEELKILERAHECSKDIDLIRVRQSFESTSKINNERRRRG